MAEQSDPKKDSKVTPLGNIPMGLTVKGLILDKTLTPRDDGTVNYHVSVAVKGLEKQLKIKVEEDAFLHLEEMTPYTSSVVFSEFNGRIYWKEASR